MRITTFNIVPKEEPMAQLNITLNQDEMRDMERFPDRVDKAQKKMQAGFRAEMQEMLYCKKIEDARKKRGQS